MVTQVDKSLLKGPLNFDLGTGLAAGGDGFLSVDLTPGSGQNPTLFLDGTQGSFRRPTIHFNYDANDNMAITITEDLVLKGEIGYYASLAHTDELRITNHATTGATAGTITFVTDNRLIVGVTEFGLEQFFGALRITSTAAGSLQGDTASKGNLYLDSADDIIKFRDPTGGLHRMLPEGTVTNATVRWNGTAWVEETEMLLEFSNGRLTLGDGTTSVAPFLEINVATGGNTLLRMREGAGVVAELQYFSFTDDWVMETKLLDSTISINPDQVTAVQFFYHQGVAMADFDAQFAGGDRGMIGLPVASDGDLDDISSVVNISDNKRAGSMMWNSSQATPVFAVGAADGSLWVDAAGATTNTPV